MFHETSWNKPRIVMKELNMEQRVFIVTLGLLVWVGMMVRWWKWHML